MLIIHQGALGDFVATFPTLIRLRKHFSRIDAVCQHQLGKLAQSLGIADASFPLESAMFASLWSDSLSPRVKDLLCAYREILLFSYSETLEQAINRATGKTCRRIIPRADADQPIHVTAHIFSQMTGCGLLSESDTAPLYTDQREAEYDSKKIWIHPGSGSKRKLWSLSNFIKLANLLESDGMKPEFIIGPAEEFLGKPLQAEGQTVHTIFDLTAIVLLLKSGGGFVGNDSGVSHLAGFLGLPTVAVFGPSDPVRWQPSGVSVKAVRPETECSPCFESFPANCDDTKCLETPPETVVEALKSLLTKTLSGVPNLQFGSSSDFRHAKV
jgi:hypothetical protein